MDRILVIAWEEDFGNFLELALERQGHGVVIAMDEDAGMEAIGSHLFDLVVLDTEMPGNGERFLAWAEKQDGCPPMILLSDTDADEDRVGCGAIIGHVLKTDGFGKLLDKIEDAFSRQRQGELWG